jgi:hypothetical protein
LNSIIFAQVENSTDLSLKSFPTIRTGLDGNLVSDTVMNHSHDRGCFGELGVGIAPVRKLSFAETAEPLLAAKSTIEKGLRLSLGWESYLLAR